MPQQDHNASELNKAQVVLGVVFIADNQAAEVVQPSEESFYLPTTLEAAQRTSVLSNAIGPAAFAVWSNHLSTKLLQNFTIQRITIVSLISNESLGDISHESLLKGLSHQFDFSRASTVCAYGERKTIAVCNCHDLGALAAFSLSHTEPP